MNKNSIPFFSLERQIHQNADGINAAIADVIASQQFIGGTFVSAFEKALARYLDCASVISCNSGTDALWMALKALDLQPNSIVLTTPFSFIASSSEIVAHGAHPVFVDIDERSFNIDPIKVRAWLEAHAIIRNGSTVHRNTGLPVVGMLAVDIFGQPADYAELASIAQAWKLWVIEDAAQSIGASLHGRKTGTLADISTFSFYPTKNLGAFGDAGCCTTNNPELAQKLAQQRNHGRTTHYDYLELGINSRLDGMQAAVLTEKLKGLDAVNARRRQIAALYDQELAHVPWLTTPHATTGEHVYHQYSVLVAEKNGSPMRDAVAQRLAEHGIQTRVFYPKILSAIPFLNLKPELANACPIAQKISDAILALPIWPELRDEEVVAVVQELTSSW